ncbi:MAG: hypothetical protein TU36_004105 [Vulcanisaeta sp. AZ3]|jgi:hypothetical protein
MVKYELRQYITQLEPIMWPRVAINIKNCIRYSIVLSVTSRNERKLIRCTNVRVLGFTLTSTGG